MNPDLRVERCKGTIDVSRVTHLLDGGSDGTVRRRQLEAMIAKDPTGVFDNSLNIYLHRTDRHVRALAKHVRLIELCRMAGICGTDGDVTSSPDWPLLLQAVADDLPTALHWVMFVPNIKSLCDEEQQKEWLPMCRDWKMIGCYAQTELGHGSNVRGLETTATFLAESQGGRKGGSWIIHSPTLTATKFWPGTLGRTANHAMVIANLIDGQGISRGMHNFLVPLRSLEDHSLLPGVESGDIGPKIGYNSMDNGFCRFNNVNIPRRNMAMRFATVDEQGIYSQSANKLDAASSKVAYITMMQVRAYICNEAGKNLAMACTIAIRYSAVRRQGFRADDNNNHNDNDKSELQILDYKQQQHRLFPRLAASYAFFFTGKKLLTTLTDVERALVTGRTRVTKHQVTDLHASSSALKSFATMFAADGMEDCRKACGGHGFLQASGLPELVTTYLQNPTVEGDNHMLPQQVLKVLLKLVLAVQTNDTKQLHQYQCCDSYDLIPSLQHILASGHNPRYECTSQHHVANNADAALQAFRHRAARLLLDCAAQLNTANSNSNTSPSQAWNHCLVPMARTSKAYAQFLILRDFHQGIAQEERAQPTKSVLQTPEINVFKDMLRLLAFRWMEADMGDFLEDAYVSPDQAKWIRQAVIQQLDKLRPNAVALCDARDFSDFRLKSVLGRYDGNVYPAIFESAQRDPLNDQPIGPGYAEHLKRLYVDGVGVYTSARL